ncbi:glycosyltransferase family 39 protein [Neobacillus pocheonensis]|uniref:Glycosyltransferase family 39 protein n=1 Tax=Neobacillus pocheonensis TaxID=363869 RepID=A0ABT0WIK9_9BACI|nr:glycosyltransferase family 39 protein [Neobacillus pocheonensis]
MDGERQCYFNGTIMKGRPNKMFKVQRLKKIIFEKPYLFFLIYSFFIMLFFTQTSPFFAINEWVDSNAFFTVGKGMANGLAPYKDLFEQKGPLLYGFHAIAYCISHTTFFGVYLLESIAMFVNLLLSFKISRLYLAWMPSVVVSLFLPLLILNTSVFGLGDSAEEFSIPFLLTFLYILLKHFKQNSESTFKWSFYIINGVLVGCIFWIKYTLVGAWIGFYLALLFILIGKKAWKELVNAIVFTFAGLLLSSIPWFIYFGIHHAIKELIDVYIKFNLITYASQTSVPVKLVNSALIFGRAFNSILEIKIMFIIGMIDFMFTWKYFQNKNQKWLLFSTVVFLILGVYFGGRDYSYYFLIITPFGLFGLIATGHFIQRSVKQIDLLNKCNWFTLFIIALTSFVLCFGYNSLITYSKLYNKAPIPQQTFAKIMDQEPHPTLLNYGALDGGFYLAADIVPNVRYFESQNIDYKLYPENMDEQNRYIKEGKIQFVVVRLLSPIPLDQVHIPNISDHYRLVSQQDQLIGGATTYRYLLYKKVK